MGIMGKVTKFLATDYINEALDKAINVVDKIEKKIPESKHEVEDLLPDEDVLLIKQEEYCLNDQFNVYDNEWNIKYIVKGKLTSVTNKLRIYDLNNNEIASIQKKLLKLRLEAMIYKVTDFIFKKNGNKVGVLKQKGTLLSTEFKLDNGWTIDNKKFSLWKYQIKNGDQVIADIREKKFEYDTYVTKFNKNVDELLVLMMVLALDSASSSRVEHLKHNYNSRKSPFLPRI